MRRADYVAGGGHGGALKLIDVCVCVIWWILDNKLWSKCKQLAPETGSIETEIQLFELWLSVASRGLLAFTFNFLQTLTSIQLFLLKWECLTSWFRTDDLVCSSKPRLSLNGSLALAPRTEAFLRAPASLSAMFPAPQRPAATKRHAGTGSSKRVEPARHGYTQI